ncbi:hypothetical protein CI088_01540 [Enterococcus plantarum]|uniref:DUF5067 domain-containing protein n=1 Tax=Enterococcus plantarum TaxID=1077675 RepID=A0A2W3ZCP9_9ENTE|nr:DUF5067 domain-containing protein [Enterococcus plantarum]PZL77511.1 hypothetical protein CI088_01540 [Enterococcus plantarum]
MNKYKQWIGIVFIVFILMVTVGCSKETLSKEETTVEGKGLTYTFTLPSGWEKQDYFKQIYGDSAVFGAEDTRSNSNMAVMIVSKEAVTEEGFGERTRKELAAKNGYKNEKDVFFVQDTINGNEVFKYTFETTFNDKSVWAHFYSLFSEHGVIQFLYYSADDSSYEKRVKIIDQSIKTVKETNFNQKKAEDDATKQQKDEVHFSTDAYDVSIIGLGTLKDEKGQPLVALRYTYTNKQKDPTEANGWGKDITLTQAGQLLTQKTLSKDTINYDIFRLQEASRTIVEKDKRVEGVLLYQLNGQASLTLTLNKGVQSKQSTYQLTIPK